MVVKLNTIEVIIHALVAMMSGRNILFQQNDFVVVSLHAGRRKPTLSSNVYVKIKRSQEERDKILIN